MADKLANEVSQIESLPTTASVLMVVCERHPLASHDEMLVAYARRLPCQCRIVYYVSLEDPVMEIFCGDWLRPLLERMGMGGTARRLRAT